MGTPSAMPWRPELAIRHGCMARRSRLEWKLQHRLPLPRACSHARMPGASRRCSAPTFCPSCHQSYPMPRCWRRCSGIKKCVMVQCAGFCQLVSGGQGYTTMCPWRAYWKPLESSPGGTRKRRPMNTAAPYRSNHKLPEQYEQRKQETTMKYAGLIGNPVGHSLSPRMQQAAFDAVSIDARYVLWETAPADLPARVASLRAPEMLGANVTIPYKVDALALVDEYDALAARVGAINTIVNREGRLIGSNTDVYGFMQALINGPARPFRIQGRRAAIIGTGGAARAAAVGLLGSGIAELMVLGRTEADR